MARGRRRVQKCVRAGASTTTSTPSAGRPRHLTFFEMLGNFSFGDYFKEPGHPAGPGSSSTEVLGLDGDRLWVTVHISDDEAEEIWRDVGRRPARAHPAARRGQLLGDGRHRPVRAVLGDLLGQGPELRPRRRARHPGGEERFVEIWNLVFTQYDQQRRRLAERRCPSRSIDTGAGLERILAVLQGSRSVYAADELRRLIDEAAAVTGARPTATDERHRRRRSASLADHARTMTFLVSDGVIPSNEDRGYVLRRIIRRAVRYAYLLGRRAVGAARPWSTRCVDVMGDAYPELVASHDLVREDRARGGAVPRDAGTGSALLDDRARRARAEGGAARRARRLPAARHLRLPARGHPGDRRRARASRSTAPASTTRWPRSASGRDADARPACQRRRRRRRSPRSSPSTARPSSPAARRTSSRRPRCSASSATADRARSHAVLRRVGRPGRRHRRRSTTDTGRAAVVDTDYGAARVCIRHALGDVDGEIDDGQAATRRDRRRAPRRHPPQPHRDPHPALGAARGPRRPRQAAGLAGRARPAALRLQPLRAGLRRRDPARSRTSPTREILDQRAGPPLRDDQGRGARLGAIVFFGDKYGDLVRVLEAGDALDRAVRRHPRRRARRHRAAEDRLGGLDRLEHPPHRGRDRHRARSTGSATRARTCCRPRPSALGVAARRPARGHRQAPRRAQGACATRSRRSAARSAAGVRPASWPTTRSTASSWPGSRPRPRTRCATSRCRSATGPASGPSCSAHRPAARASRWWPPSRPDSGLERRRADRRRRQAGRRRRRQGRRSGRGRRPGPVASSTRRSTWSEPPSASPPEPRPCGPLGVDLGVQAHRHRPLRLRRHRWRPRTRSSSAAATGPATTGGSRELVAEARPRSSWWACRYRLDGSIGPAAEARPR